MARGVLAVVAMTMTGLVAISPAMGQEKLNGPVFGQEKALKLDWSQVLAQKLLKRAREDALNYLDGVVAEATNLAPARDVGARIGENVFRLETLGLFNDVVVMVHKIAAHRDEGQIFDTDDLQGLLGMWVKQHAMGLMAHKIELQREAVRDRGMAAVNERLYIEHLHRSMLPPEGVMWPLMPKFMQKALNPLAMKDVQEHMMGNLTVEDVAGDLRQGMPYGVGQPVDASLVMALAKQVVLMARFPDAGALKAFQLSDVPYDPQNERTRLLGMLDGKSELPRYAPAR